MRIILVLLLVSCGDGDGDGGQSAAPVASVEDGDDDKSQSSYTKLIAAGEDKPDCGEDNPSELIYVVDEEEFQYCDGGKWKSVDLKGEDGVDGKDGTDAELPAHIKRQWVCNGSSEVMDADLDLWAWNTYVTEFYDDSYEINCRTVINYLSSTSEFSFTDFWPADSPQIRQGRSVLCSTNSLMKAEFSLKEYNVTYSNPTDDDYLEVADCERMYP
jgi:hypothetical protein